MMHDDSLYSGLIIAVGTVAAVLLVLMLRRW